MYNVSLELAVIRINFAGTGQKRSSVMLKLCVFLKCRREKTICLHIQPYIVPSIERGCVHGAVVDICRRSVHIVGVIEAHFLWNFNSLK